MKIKYPSWKCKICRNVAVKDGYCRSCLPRPRNPFERNPWLW